MNPMFLAYSPPQMLPTITMNPTAAAPTATGNFKRGMDEWVLPLNKGAAHMKRDTTRPLMHLLDLNMLWWAGVGMTVFGGAAYLL
jgi:hypothetical protein